MLGQAGTTSIEFAVLALPLILIMLAGMDLGRYFITQQSLHTLTSEAARAAVVNCFGLNPCATPVPTPAILWAKVPSLNSAAPGASLSVTQSRNATTGVRTVTATAHYEFAFVLPAWTGLNATLNPIIDTTELQY